MNKINRSYYNNTIQNFLKNNTSFILGVVIVIALLVGFAFLGNYFFIKDVVPNDNDSVSNANDFVKKVGNMGAVQHVEDVSEEVVPEVVAQEELSEESFAQPLDDCEGRVTQKPFGIYITPSTSPVQPERFEGFHAGADFEVLPEELNQELQVYAICEGEIIAQRRVSGYGGVVVESCELEGEPVTVLYGHLNLSSVSGALGSEVRAGDVIGSLGEANSTQTDGERKHLHLSIKKGSEIDVRGYAQSEAELVNWVNPLLYVCQGRK